MIIGFRALRLQKRGLIYVGTVRKNKREIPSKFIKANKKSRSVNSFLYGFTYDTAYIPKQGKIVLLILFMYHSIPITENDKPDQLL